MLNKKIKEIINELKEMVRVDQEMRDKVVQAQAEGKDLMFYFDPAVDIKNTLRLKEIIDQIGWPKISLVGEETSADAWLLVQHADHDVEFQKYCLELMIQAGEGEVSKRNIAYLSDRITVHEKRPQLYGTQFANDEKNVVKMGEVIDPENLDKRRAEMGMEPFAQYLETFYQSPIGKALKK